DLVLIAESDLNDPRVVRPREVGGHGMDSVWNEDFHHALHAVLTGEDDGYYSDFGTIGAIAWCLERGAVYDGRYSKFRKRRHGRRRSGRAGARSSPRSAGRRRRSRTPRTRRRSNAPSSAGRSWPSPSTPGCWSGTAASWSCGAASPT